MFLTSSSIVRTTTGALEGLVRRERVRYMSELGVARVCRMFNNGLSQNHNYRAGRSSSSHHA